MADDQMTDQTCVSCNDAPATTEVHGQPSCQRCHDEFYGSWADGLDRADDDPSTELRRAALNHRGRP